MVKCVFAELFILLLSPTLQLVLDLSSNDWYIESEIPKRELDNVVRVISHQFKDEVRRTGRISLNGTVPGYVLSDLFSNGVIGLFLTILFYFMRFFG